MWNKRSNNNVVSYNIFHYVVKTVGNESYVVNDIPLPDNLLTVNGKKKKKIKFINSPRI